MVLLMPIQLMPQTQRITWQNAQIEVPAIEIQANAYVTLQCLKDRHARDFRAPMTAQARAGVLVPRRWQD